MEKPNRIALTASIALISLGVISFVMNITLGLNFNIGWPLLLIMLGAAFILLVRVLAEQWRSSYWLFLPGALLGTLGIIFLLNILTGDWNAWAYAWLLALAGAGVGVLLAARAGGWARWARLAGLGLALGGVTLAVLFGAITGGVFIQVMAPILLVAGGISLRWVKLDRLFPRKPALAQPPTSSSSANPGAQAAALVEPLSQREVEVLGMIAQGLTNAEIATRLTLAQSTVKTHINNIYGKLGVQTRIAAIQRARDLGLV